MRGAELSRVEGRLLDREDGLSKKRKPPDAAFSAAAAAAGTGGEVEGEGEAEGEGVTEEIGETSSGWWT